MSKGSVPRPFAVSNEEYANRWDAIFGTDAKPTKKEPMTWPFPTELLPTTPLDKLPFNPENEDDAPL
jgi:hypothetical protein